MLKSNLLNTINICIGHLSSHSLVIHIDWSLIYQVSLIYMLVAILTPFFFLNLWHFSECSGLKWPLWMQYSSILTSPAVGRRTAVTIASMNGHAGVFQSEAPVGHPGYSATAPGVSRFPPPSLPLPYHMLLGKNSGFVTHPVHQRWSCSASVSCKLWCDDHLLYAFAVATHLTL